MEVEHFLIRFNRNGFLFDGTLILLSKALTFTK